MTTPDQGGGRKQARRERARRNDCEPPPDNTGGHSRLSAEAVRPPPFSLFAEDEDDAGERHRSRQGRRRLRRLSRMMTPGAERSGARLQARMPDAGAHDIMRIVRRRDALRGFVLL